MQGRVVVLGLDEARQSTDDHILQAEQFKVAITQPSGMVQIDELEETPVVYGNKDGVGVSDDDFFHIMSHVNKAVVAKIERGEFVDLEKLLPRDCSYKGNEGRMEWMHKDGNTYLVPVSREQKINSVRCWEQAFRVYATIYCGANPSRAKEIWQYVSVINFAAASYVWENVAAYDINFRHLMEFNPRRSWGVMYNQMWNLCLRDPIVKNTQFAAITAFTQVL